MTLCCFISGSANWQVIYKTCTQCWLSDKQFPDEKLSEPYEGKIKPGKDYNNAYEASG